MTVRRVNKRAREERYHETEKDKDIFLERMLTNQPMVTWSFVLHTLLSCPIIKDSQCQSNYQHYFEVFYIKEYRVFFTEGHTQELFPFELYSTSNE